MGIVVGGVMLGSLVPFGIFGAAFLAWMLVATILGTFFIFTYPLILDRRLEAVPAIKLSLRAARANIAGLLGSASATWARS